MNTKIAVPVCEISTYPHGHFETIGNGLEKALLPGKNASFVCDDSYRAISSNQNESHLSETSIDIMCLSNGYLSDEPNCTKGIILSNSSS